MGCLVWARGEVAQHEPEPVLSGEPVAVGLGKQAQVVFFSEETFPLVLKLKNSGSTPQGSLNLGS